MDIRPGPEPGPAAAANNDTAQVIIPAKIIGNPGKLPPHRFGQRVFALRLRNGDGCNAAVIDIDGKSGFLRHGSAFQLNSVKLYQINPKPDFANA
jgi:hypothetical protein